MINAFTVDVEDYFQVSGFERDIDRNGWDHYQSRVAPSTRRLLGLLDRHQVRATFFVLGWTARKHPELVREIQSAGHEIGSHSYWHRLIYRMTPEEFRRDLLDSKAAIEDACGERVKAFRAPSFSIVRDSLWALEILADEGIELDASIFPVRHDRYGIPNAERLPHAIETQCGRLLEFPTSVLPVGRYNLPVSGGGYFRLFPLGLTLKALSRLNGRWRRPFVFYVHPWEVDPEQPRLRAGSRQSRFRHYVNLRSTERKLDCLLSRFRFGTLSEAWEEIRDVPNYRSAADGLEPCVLN